MRALEELNLLWCGVCGSLQVACVRTTYGRLNFKGRDIFQRLGAWLLLLRLREIGLIKGSSRTAEGTNAWVQMSARRCLISS